MGYIGHFLFYLSSEDKSEIFSLIHFDHCLGEISFTL